MRLVLARHAESTWNATGRWQGQSDVPLSPRGRLQARALAGRFFGASFHRRICSDLSRAAETAAATGLETTPDPRLREIDVGAWAGLSRADVAERFPEQVAGLRRGEPVRIGGGESMDEFEARVDGVVDELRAAHAGEAVLAVTHGGVIRALATRVLGVRGRTSPLVGVSNTSLSVFADRGGLVLEVYNDHLHLDPADRDSSVMALPESFVQLSLIAAAQDAPPDRRLADTLLGWLGIPQFFAVGAARASALAEHIVADPSDGPATALAHRLRDEHDEGAFGILAPPEEIRRLTADLLDVDVGGLAIPAHGSVARVRLAASGALLASYGVHVARAETLP